VKNTDKKITDLRKLLHSALEKLGYRDDHLKRPEVTLAEFEAAEEMIGRGIALCSQIGFEDFGIKTDADGEPIQ
jgi:hypothetical protein